MRRGGPAYPADVRHHAHGGRLPAVGPGDPGARRLAGRAAGAPRGVAPADPDGAVAGHPRLAGLPAGRPAPRRAGGHRRLPVVEAVADPSAGRRGPVLIAVLAGAVLAAGLAAWAVLPTERQSAAGSDLAPLPVPSAATGETRPQRAAVSARPRTATSTAARPTRSATTPSQTPTALAPPAAGVTARYRTASTRIFGYTGEVVLDNSGVARAKGWTVVITLSKGGTVASVNGADWPPSRPAITFTGPPVPAGGSRTFTFDVRDSDPLTKAPEGCTIGADPCDGATATPSTATRPAARGQPCAAAWARAARRTSSRWCSPSWTVCRPSQSSVRTCGCGQKYSPVTGQLRRAEAGERGRHVRGGRGQLGEHGRWVLRVVRVGDGALVATHRRELLLLDHPGPARVAHPAPGAHPGRGRCTRAAVSAPPGPVGGVRPAPRPAPPRTARRGRAGAAAPPGRARR